MQVGGAPTVHFRAGARACKGKVAALFAGQGAQYVNMFEDVAMNFPPFRTAVTEMDAAAASVDRGGACCKSKCARKTKPCGMGFDRDCFVLPAR